VKRKVFFRNLQNDSNGFYLIKSEMGDNDREAGRYKESRIKKFIDRGVD
jgi:hypothetical protein